MRATVLGTGTSMGVPVIGCTCDVCTSDDPRDRRTRVSAVVERDGRHVLIDTPPELRLQLRAAGVATVDAVLYTHDHADHVHGIDDLRPISMRHGTVPAYGPADTLERIRRRFDYIFDERVQPPKGTHKPQITTHPLAPFERRDIAGISVTAVAVPHGDLTVFGYRFADFAYITDAKTVPEDAVSALRGVRYLVLNALFDRPHPMHLSIDEAVEVARLVGAERTYLTHLTHRFGHTALLDRLPEGIEPAYDGLSFTF